MNWRRGFLRLWFLFALVWIVPVTALGVLQWRSELPTIHRVRGPDGSIYRVEATRGERPAEITAFVTSYVESNPPSEECASAAPPESCFTPVLIDMPTPPSSFQVWRFVGVGLGVPFALFAIGASIAWAFAGFSGRPRSKSVADPDEDTTGITESKTTQH